MTTERRHIRPFAERSDVQSIAAALPAYGEVAALSDAEGRGMLARSQDRWLQARNEACPASDAGLSACIREMTEQRLGLLSGRPGAKELRHLLSAEVQQGMDLDKVFNQAAKIATLAA